VLDASDTMIWPWPWPLTPQNLISSSLSQDAPMTKVWQKSITRYWSYHRNIVSDSQTDSCTDRGVQNIGASGTYFVSGKGLIKKIQCESKKSPPEDLWQFFHNGWEFFNQILRAFYAFLSMLNYKFLFNYLQLWRSYVILSVTAQFTSCVQNVHHRPKCTLAFSDIFPKQLGIFSPNFTGLLNVHTYARMQIFIQLSSILTKLCHIKCDHPACVSVDGGHFEHIMVCRA